MLKGVFERDVPGIGREVILNTELISHSNQTHENGKHSAMLQLMQKTITSTIRHSISHYKYDTAIISLTLPL